MAIAVSDKVYSYLESLYGKEIADKYSEFIDAEPVQYIRVNSLKISTSDLKNRLQNQYGIESETIDGLPYSLKITAGSELIGKTIEHILGLYYVQGLSSMLPPVVLAPNEDDIVLDLCAAPGSKTTQLAEMMLNKGTLIANEVSLDRVKMLVYNLDRMNVVNTGTLQNKGEILSKIYSEHFDKILVDAPCSGLGIMQKKGEVNNWWSKERAAKLGEVQTKLLVAAIKMLRVGGEIVYSTCTLTPEENEMVLDKLLRKYPIEAIDISLPVPTRDAFDSYDGKNFTEEISKAKRILPWEVNSDGFFIIKLKKIGGTSSPEPANLKSSDLKLLNPNSKEVKKYTEPIEEEFGITDKILNRFNYIFKGKNIFIIDNKWNDNPGIFQRVGIKFGTIDKRGGVTLTAQAVQILQPFITEKIYRIESTEDLKTYMEGGTIKGSFKLFGQVVVKNNDYILGTAVMTDAGLKSRFPRANRTQNILIT